MPALRISIVKKSDLLAFLSAADPSWKKYPTSGWTVQTNGRLKFEC